MCWYTWRRRLGHNATCIGCLILEYQVCFFTRLSVTEIHDRMRRRWRWRGRWHVTWGDDPCGRLASTRGPPCRRPRVTSAPRPRGRPSSCGCPRASPSDLRGWSLCHKHRKWRVSPPCVGTCGVADPSCG